MRILIIAIYKIHIRNTVQRSESILWSNCNRAHGKKIGRNAGVVEASERRWHRERHSALHRGSVLSAQPATSTGAVAA